MKPNLHHLHKITKLCSFTAVARAHKGAQGTMLHVTQMILLLNYSHLTQLSPWKITTTLNPCERARANLQF